MLYIFSKNDFKYCVGALLDGWAKESFRGGGVKAITRNAYSFQKGHSSLI
jgi:hypothetical protein